MDERRIPLHAPEDEHPEDRFEPDAPRQEGVSAWVAAAAHQAPWWVISVVFHGFAILLLSLVTWVVRGPNLIEEIMTVVTLEPRPDVKLETPKPGDSPTPTHYAPPTDPGAQTPSEIVVPPWMLVFSDLGSRWQTDTPELPDTGGAYGVENSRSFHDRHGIVDDPGGGGGGGEAFEAFIGMGGAAYKGTGGGRFGGNGTGDGVQDGPGRGTFGRPDQAGRLPMVLRHKGSPPTDSAAQAALKWLADHQEADGHWDTVKFGAHVKTDTACTGFALLAFLGYGHTERTTRYGDNVRRAVAWLRSKQNAEGLVFDTSDAGAHRAVGYPHAIAGLALVEAAGMARVPATVAAAQKAVDYSCNVHQQGEGYEKLGWRYKTQQPGDLSVTGWYVMQLKSARVARLRVDHTALEGAMRFLDSVERKGAGGDTGYGPASIYSYQPADQHAHTAYRLTAIGTLCRQFLGAKRDALQSTVDWFMEKGGLPDAWTPDRVDLYYWYYGTLCAYQQGGESFDKWNNAMKRTLCDNQRRDGDDKGSWDPIGAYSPEWGRVGQTALTCMCLEVYVRYALMCQD